MTFDDPHPLEQTAGIGTDTVATDPGPAGAAYLRL